jgi:threonine dehydrogenase-like Zn-dependent dehydrogenase
VVAAPPPSASAGPWAAGLAEQAVAHETQLFPIGDLPSARAALTEPASIALHAALHWHGTKGARAVVIGPGVIGLLVVAALRRLHPDLHISMVSPSEFGATWSTRVGADRILPARAAAVTAVAEADGGRLLQTMELSLGVALRILRLLVGQDFQPVTVHLPHHPLTSTAEYVRYIGGHPRFAEPFAGFTVRSSDLTRPVSTDGSVHDAVRAYLDTVAPPGTPDTAGRTRVCCAAGCSTGPSCRSGLWSPSARSPCEAEAI